MRPGSAVDLARYSHRQRIEVPPSSEGLAQLRLGAEELARLRADLGDLRLVDDDGRQLPYLLERTEDLRVSLIVAAPVAHEGESHYQLSLPATPLTLVSIDVAPAAPYVDRPYRLVSGSGDDAITIAAGNLRRRPGTPDDLRIAIPSVGRERFDQLTLIVDDGDDAALAITGAQAEVATADVFVVAPAGFHWLLLGDPAAEPPRYELHSARDLVLAVTSAAVKRGALEPNPGYAPAAPSDPRGPVVLLWIVLAAAVLILGAITLRAARTTPPAQTPEVE
jgi:hypothetical protein